MANSAFNHEPSFTIPGSTTDNAVIRWDGTSGAGQQNSGILIDDSNVITGVTSLTVDNLLINGNTISSTAGTDLLITPLSGQQIVLDGTIIIDAGVVTAATSITSTEFVGGGVGLTALNGTQVTSGTLPAARIGADSIVEGKLNVSNGPTNGYILTARDGVAGGFTWEAAAGGGLDSDADAIIHNNYGFVLGHTGQLPAGDNPANTLAEFQIISTGDPDAAMHFIRHSNNGEPSFIRFAKSRNGTVGSNTVLQNNDIVGSIDYFGDDGTDIHSYLARIMVRVDGTPGSNDMPGRIEFHTTADGSTASTERMRIGANGAVTTPSQPCFYSALQSHCSNVTGDGTAYTMKSSSTPSASWGESGMGGRQFDNGSVFSGGTFTAPVDGYYYIGAHLGILQVSGSHDYCRLLMITSNGNFPLCTFNASGVFTGTGQDLVMGGTVLAYLDANDTAYLYVTVYGGSKVIDIQGHDDNNPTRFFAMLMA